ncbi:MAG: Competence protein ComEA [Oscillospiraceae bacterium]|jgi:competence protein ComEA
MDEESRQKKLLILLASIVCAVLIGYNAFYVPDATIAWKQVSSFPSGSSISSEERANLSVDSQSLSSVMMPQDEPSAVSANRFTISRQNGKININTASAQELQDGLDGIGEVLAQRIVDYRETNGPYHSIEEIKNVSGIGDIIFEHIRDSITVQ